MNEIVKKDILRILDKALILLEQKDFFHMKKLSNHTIHNASIFQDEFSVSMAVVVYSLSKIFERGTPKADDIKRLLAQAQAFLERDDIKSYKAIVKNILKYIADVDSQLKLYIEEVVKQAEIKKSTKIYDHGISLGQAANILGISQWELMNYVGKTEFIEYQRPDAVEKVKFTRELFK